MKAQDYIRQSKIQREAEGYLELGMAQQALDVMSRLGDPEDFDLTAQYICGEALRLLGRYEEAIEPLRRAAQTSVENIHPYLSLAWCYKRVGRLDMAINALEQALATEPNEPLLRYNLACYFSLAGNKNRALRYLSQTLSAAPFYRRLIDNEPDFNPLRQDPDFQSLCRNVKAS
ncbi:MAG: TPR end-of-group domain-containing protein [Thermoguttaceae bacterium]